MNVKLAAICDYALVDKDNKLSMMGMFDIINVGKLPVTHPQFFFVAIFDVGEMDHGREFDIEFFFNDADGKVIVKRTGKFKCPKADSYRYITSMNQTQITMAGDYELGVKIGDERAVTNLAIIKR